MSHPIYKVVRFHIEDRYTLRVDFDDDTYQVIDFEPILEGDLYSPLPDVTLFKQVSIDPEVHTLIWPMEQILTRLLYMIGHGTLKSLGKWRKDGL